MMARKRANKEGTIYKLSSGRWCAQLSLDAQRMSRTFDTQKEGLDWIRKTRGQIDDGMNYANTKITLGEFLKGWLTSNTATRQRSTWVKNEQICRGYIIPNLGHVKIRDLRPEHIQGLYRSLLDQRIGTYTIIKVHTVLHSALQQATLTGMISRNPASYAQLPREPANEMAILNESQVSQLLVAANGHRWEALYHLAIVTGMRQMEILGLKWTDLDWLRQTLKVERQLIRPDGNGVEFSSPKTRYGKRSIALGGKTVDVLRAHLLYQQGEKTAAGEAWIETGLIFTNSLGGPIDPRNLLRNYKQLLRDAGLPAIRFHDLRHTAASLMLNAGIPVIVVSRRLGHAKASITLYVYGHLIPSMQSEAAELIDQMVTPVAVEFTKTKIES
jgi:integrase